MYIPQIKCHICDREFKIDDLVQRVHLVCKSTGWEKVFGNEHTEPISIHLKCPRDLEKLMRRAAEKDYEKRIKKDNSPDAICMPLGGGSKAAMDYVQEQNEPKE